LLQDAVPDYSPRLAPKPLTQIAELNEYRGGQVTSLSA